MGAAGGPNMVEDGMVFYYDTGNRKSYKGEPTTNFMPTVYQQGATSSGTDEIGSYFEGTITRIGCPNVTYINSGATYTFTIEIRADKSFNMSADSNQYAPENAGNDANRVSVTYIRPNYTTPNEWVKYSTTVVMKSGLTNPYMFDFFIPVSFTGRMYYRNAQLEYKPHATPFTPSGTTRSATQGLVDLTSNSAIDLSNVAFDSNAQIYFDGTDDYFTTSGLSIGTPSSVSFETVIKFDGTLDSNDRKVFHWDKTGTTNGVAQIRKGTNNGRLMYQHHDGTTWYTLSVDDVVTSDTYIHILVVHSSTTATMYKNGVQVGTASVSNLEYTNAGEILIGYRASSEYWKGDIPIFKVYDKALSAEQVKNNYNGIKKRFGI